MSTFFKQKNHKKMVTRCGAVDHETYETERLLIINSYCKSVGYSSEQLPYNVSAPSMANDDRKEYMGFSYKLPRDMDNVSNPTEDANAVLEVEDDLAIEDQDGSEEINPNRSDPDVAEFLRDLFGDELDVEVELDSGDGDFTMDPGAQEELRCVNIRLFGFGFFSLVIQSCELSTVATL